jgi:hypothetical protein
MDGETETGFVLDLNRDCFPIAMEIGSLRGNVQRVEQLSHGKSLRELKSLGQQPVPPGLNRRFSGGVGHADVEERTVPAIAPWFCRGCHTGLVETVHLDCQRFCPDAELG